MPSRSSQNMPNRPLVANPCSNEGARDCPQLPPVRFNACPTSTPIFASKSTSSVGSEKRRSKRACTCSLMVRSSWCLSAESCRTKLSQSCAPIQKTAPSSTRVIMIRLKSVGPSSCPVYRPVRLPLPSTFAPGFAPGLSVGTLPSGLSTVKMKEPRST